MVWVGFHVRRTILSFRLHPDLQWEGDQRCSLRAVYFANFEIMDGANEARMKRPETEAGKSPRLYFLFND